MEPGEKTAAAGKSPPPRIAAAAAADAERSSRPGGGVRSGHRYGSFSSMLLGKSPAIPSIPPRASFWAPDRRDEGEAEVATASGGDGIGGRASLLLRGLPRLRAASAATTRGERPAVEIKVAWRRGLIFGVVDRILVMIVFAHPSYNQQGMSPFLLFVWAL